MNELKLRREKSRTSTEFHHEEHSSQQMPDPEKEFLVEFKGEIERCAQNGSPMTIKGAKTIIGKYGNTARLVEHHYGDKDKNIFFYLASVSPQVHSVSKRRLESDKDFRELITDLVEKSSSCKYTPLVRTLSKGAPNLNIVEYAVLKSNELYAYCFFQTLFGYLPKVHHNEYTHILKELILSICRDREGNSALVFNQEMAQRKFLDDYALFQSKIVFYFLDNFKNLKCEFSLKEKTEIYQAMASVVNKKMTASHRVAYMKDPESASRLTFINAVINCCLKDRGDISFLSKISKERLVELMREKNDLRGDNGLLSAVYWININAEAFRNIVGYLLQNATPDVITERNRDGNNILHNLFERDKWDILPEAFYTLVPYIDVALLNKLMLERNSKGHSPLVYAMKLFSIQGSPHKTLSPDAKKRGFIDFLKHVIVLLSDEFFRENLDNEGNTLLSFFLRNRQLYNDLIPLVIKKSINNYNELSPELQAFISQEEYEGYKKKAGSNEADMHTYYVRKSDHTRICGQLEDEKTKHQKTIEQNEKLKKQLKEMEEENKRLKDQSKNDKVSLERSEREKQQLQEQLRRTELDKQKMQDENTRLTEDLKVAQKSNTELKSQLQKQQAPKENVTKESHTLEEGELPNSQLESTIQQNNEEKTNQIPQTVVANVPTEELTKPNEDQDDQSSHHSSEDESQKTSDKDMQDEDDMGKNKSEKSKSEHSSKNQSTNKRSRGSDEEDFTLPPPAKKQKQSESEEEDVSLNEVSNNNHGNNNLQKSNELFIEVDNPIEIDNGEQNMGELEQPEQNEQLPAVPNNSPVTPVSNIFSPDFLVENLLSFNFFSSSVEKAPVYDPSKKKSSELKTKSKSTLSNFFNSAGKDKLTDEDKKKIGEWGETWIFFYLLDHYGKKHSTAQKIKTDTGYKFVIGDEAVEIKWLNKDKEKDIYLESGADHDFEIIKTKGNEIKKRYIIEAKSTRREEKTLASFSGRELLLIVQYKGEKKENQEKYRLFRLYNAGKKDARLYKINHVYERIEQQELPVKLNMNI